MNRVPTPWEINIPEHFGDALAAEVAAGDIDEGEIAIVQPTGCRPANARRKKAFEASA